MRADVITTRTDLTGYDLIVTPILHVVPSGLAERLTAFVNGGGHLVATYFSGIVDENDHVLLGGYPGALRDLLGLRIEEFGPLPDGEGVRLDSGETGTLWTDAITVTGPQVQILARYADGPQAGRAAITRNEVGEGTAAYVSTRLGAAQLSKLLGRLLRRAGVGSELPATARGRVDLTVRQGEDAEYWFLANRTDEPVELPGLGGEDLTLPSPGTATEAHRIPGRGVLVLRRPARRR